MYAVACRDGTVYGCGLTEHGQLPYLRSGLPHVQRARDSADGAGSSGGEGDEPGRCEVTIPTRLGLPFLQQARPGQGCAGYVKGGY